MFLQIFEIQLPELNTLKDCEAIEVLKLDRMKAFDEDTLALLASVAVGLRVRNRRGLRGVQEGVGTKGGGGECY